MELTLFQHSSTGRIVRAMGGHSAFVPHPLPPDLRWTPDLIALLSDADRAVGYLGGLGQVLPNPYLLVCPLQHQEAVLSSRIEGTQASLSDLYIYEGQQRLAAAPLPEDVQEVHNYVRALDYGLGEMRADRPVTLRLIRELHALLMAGVRGNWRKPGQFRVTQNWIGPPSCRLEQAPFVPAPPELLQDALRDWEAFANAPAASWPPLVRLALLHYQFEALHPFLDGNGRVGRLVLALLLASWDVLAQPLLYLSAYFERRRQLYYALLLDVSQSGAWEAWVRFFLQGVAAQSHDVRHKGQQLLDLYARYREQYATSSKLQALVEVLFENPLVTGALVVQRLGVSSATAYQYLALMEKHGILRETTGRKRGRRYAAFEILRIVQSPLDLKSFLNDSSAFF